MNPLGSRPRAAPPVTRLHLRAAEGAPSPPREANFGPRRPDPRPIHPAASRPGSFQPYPPPQTHFGAPTNSARPTGAAQRLRGPRGQRPPRPDLIDRALITVRGLLKTLRAELLPAQHASAQDEPFTLHFERALAGELRRGRRVLAIVAVAVLGWAGLMPISGAVIVAGSLVAQSSVKKVQHPTGGVVAEIRVRNGSKVKAGDELVRLDQTSARTNLQVIARKLDEVRLKMARLSAEREGSGEPRWPAAMAAEVDPLDRDRLLSSEQGLFAARADARRNQQDLADSRIQQLAK